MSKRVPDFDFTGSSDSEKESKRPRTAADTPSVFTPLEKLRCLVCLEVMDQTEDKRIRLCPRHVKPPRSSFTIVSTTARPSTPAPSPVKVKQEEPDKSPSPLMLSAPSYSILEKDTPPSSPIPALEPVEHDAMLPHVLEPRASSSVYTRYHPIREGTQPDASDDLDSNLDEDDALEGLDEDDELDGEEVSEICERVHRDCTSMVLQAAVNAKRIKEAFKDVEDCKFQMQSFVRCASLTRRKLDRVMHFLDETTRVNNELSEQAWKLKNFNASHA